LGDPVDSNHHEKDKAEADEFAQLLLFEFAKAEFAKPHQ
jgi:hypothetical protein